MNGKMVLTRRRPELRTLQRATMCGLCHQVGRLHGLRWRLFAGPDMVTYQVFLDVCAGTGPRYERRACVVLPAVSSLPSAIPTERTATAVDVGVWLGSMKLEDDRRDEGTTKAALAQRFLGGRSAVAEQALRERGFPVEEIASWMERQAAIEERREPTLEVALGPTAEIAALTFGFGGREGGPIDPERARAIGRAVGTYLFWLDALQDVEEDAAADRYNPLLAASGGRALLLPARAAAVAGARRAIRELKSLLADLPASAGTTYLREVFVQGFAARLRHLEEGLPRPTAWDRLLTLVLRVAPRVRATWIRLAVVALTLVGRKASAARLIPPHPTRDHAFTWLCGPVGDCSNDGDFDFWDVCCFSDDCACVDACDGCVDVCGLCTGVDCDPDCACDSSSPTGTTTGGTSGCGGGGPTTFHTGDLDADVDADVDTDVDTDADTDTAGPHSGIGPETGDTGGGSGHTGGSGAPSGSTGDTAGSGGTGDTGTP